ncbi:MAG: SGNH/GDSL hydrolase family protein [candidate division NC10 bacterium]|nr:SGNH/GDSL hydrolase family protein [candidate division NC10 bacterium]
MMKQFMRALLCLGLLLPLGAKAEEFSDIFVFGDSLSDTGNAATLADAAPLLLTSNPKFLKFLTFLTNPTMTGPRVALCFPDVTFEGDPPIIKDVDPDFPCADLFFESSRVSNGPVAVEILAKRFGFEDLQPSLHFLPLVGLEPFRPPDFGTNYAVAAATARGSDLIDLIDLNVQIAGFLADLADLPAASDALYVFMIGGNDVIDAANALAELVIGSTPDEMPGAIIDDAVAAIGDNINLLVGAGARKFLVVNSPNIGSLPAAESGLARAIATFVTIKFNEQLAERLDQIQAGQPLVEIKQFDLFRFFEVVRFFGKLFGVFENIKDACFDSGEYRDTGARNFDPGCGVDKFDDFVFFDAIHPTGQVHQFVGKALSRAAHKLIDD